MKKLLSIILTLVLLLSIIPLSGITVSAASYPSDYKKWSQGASDYDWMKSNGCFIVAQSKLIYEADINTATSFNPDTLYRFRVDNNYANGPSLPVQYANYVGQTLNYLGSTTTDITNKIWDNISKGYFTLLFVTKSNVPSHYIMIANELSKQYGELYCYNSWTGYSSVSPMSMSSTGYTIGTVYTYSSPSSSSTLTIKYHANGGYIKSDKKDEIYIDSNGLMRKYSTNDYYSNNWTYGTSYSNGLINASSFGVVKDGYKFAGWSLSKNGGTVYDQTTARKPEDIYPDLKNGSATITMYAVWEPNILSVKYNANGGYITTDKLATYSVNKNEIILNSSAKEYINKKNYGETWKNGLTDDTTFGLSKKCHEFIGWSLAKTGKPVYDKATTFATETFYPDIKKGDATVTVYAIWKETNHTYSNSSDTVCNECGKTRQLGSQLIKESSVTYYYYNGVKSTSTGIFDYNGKKIYINKGRFLGSSGLVTIGGQKMYINKGYFTGASGLVTIGGKKMYINKGYFTGASGLVTIKGKKMYINKGYFTGASGLVTIKGKKMYINKGYFLGATGIVKIGSKRYYIKKGYAQLSFSGKVKISGKTYTIKKGIVK